MLEAGPSERHPLVSMPFGLVWLMGSARDWRFKTVPQRNAGNREITIPRGKMIGGSGSINSMVWFRGRMADFDSWDMDGWRGADVSPAFDALEAAIKPTRFDRAHPLSQAVLGMIGANTPSRLRKFGTVSAQHDTQQTSLLCNRISAAHKTRENPNRGACRSPDLGR